MFGKKLKEARKARKLTQKELAELVGVTKTTVSGWETDAYMPSMPTMILVAKILHTSIDYLVGISNKYTIDIEGLSEKQIYQLELFAESLKGEWTTYETM